MPQGSPGGTVLRVDVRQLQVVLNGVMVFAVGSAVFGQLVRYVHESVIVGSLALAIGAGRVQLLQIP